MIIVSFAAEDFGFLAGESGFSIATGAAILVGGDECKSARPSSTTTAAIVASPTVKNA
jgi:hypothetical protein